MLQSGRSTVLIFVPAHRAKTENQDLSEYGHRTKSREGSYLNDGSGDISCADVKCAAPLNECHIRNCSVRRRQLCPQPFPTTYLNAALMLQRQFLEICNAAFAHSGSGGYVPFAPCRLVMGTDFAKLAICALLPLVLAAECAAATMVRERQLPSNRRRTRARAANGSFPPFVTTSAFGS